MQHQSIFDFIKSARHNYEHEYVKITDGLEHNQRHTLRLADLYYNSKFESGQTDQLGREKPYHNIVRSRVHLAVRATDDGGQIKVAPKRGRSDRKAHALLLNAQDAEWRDDVEFDAFRRKLRYTRAKYGGAVVKKSKDGGKLKLHVVDWSNLITDQIDILANPIIERHMYNPAALMEMDWENKEDAIRLAHKNRAAQASDTTTADNLTIGSFIEVYEVSGVLPMHMYEEDGDENEYKRVKFIVVLDNEKDDAKSVGGIILYKGLQKDTPYDYLPWIEVQGRALGLGVTEMLFEPQVWMNYTKLAERDMLDIARLVLFQTDDPSFDLQNAITDVYSGNVFKMTKGSSIQQVNTTPTSLPAFDRHGKSWEELADKEANSFDAITGEQQTSGSPYRQTLLLNNAAGSEFKYRRKEERDFIRRVYRSWVLPFHLTQVDTKTEMEAVLSDEELQFVDSIIMASKEKEALFQGKLVSPDAVQQLRSQVGQKLQLSGKNRKITSIPKGMFKADILTDLDVIVGTENDADGRLTLLERFFSVFGQAIANPEFMQNPIVMNVIKQAGEAAGIDTEAKGLVSASPIAGEVSSSTNMV